MRFIKENGVDVFVSRVSEQGSEADKGGSTFGSGALAEEAMMERMGILVVCRFERLLVQEQVIGRWGCAKSGQMTVARVREDECFTPVSCMKTARRSQSSAVLVATSVQARHQHGVLRIVLRMRRSLVASAQYDRMTTKPRSTPSSSPTVCASETMQRTLDGHPICIRCRS